MKCETNICERDARADFFSQEVCKAMGGLYVTHFVLSDYFGYLSKGKTLKNQGMFFLKSFIIN